MQTLVTPISDSRWDRPPGLSWRGIRVLSLLLLTLPQSAQTITISLPSDKSTQPLDGRLLLLLSTDPKAEPRFQITDGGPNSQLVFGQDIENWKPGATIAFNTDSFGYPIHSLKDLKPGDYHVQALLDIYETFHLAGGRTLKLPTDRGEGRQWNRAPGNLYSTPAKLSVSTTAKLNLTLDQQIPPIPPPQDTKYIKHIRIQSALLTKFWGRPMYLGAHVLLPEGFDQHPEARYPLIINHGHFPADFSGFRTEPPDDNLKPEYNQRFKLEGYNRIVQQEAYDFYKKWTSPGFPRMLIVEIQHANPYYDDSYAVNSANVGPYGDAIMRDGPPARSDPATVPPCAARGQRRVG